MLLVTAECDWRFIVRAFDTSADRPNVIVLLPKFDTGLWVLGYDTGAFDVLPIDVDGERLVFTAKKEIVLRCGKASITLTRAGKILIRGAYLLSRSSGVNRIKGGSVKIN